jgi:hypothetical protein
MIAPEVERIAASVMASDGLPRYVWTDSRPDPATYAQVILAAIMERQQWHAQYEAAKAVEGVWATGPPDPISTGPSPDNQPISGPEGSLSRVERSGIRQDASVASALDG